MKKLLILILIFISVSSCVTKRPLIRSLPLVNTGTSANSGTGDPLRTAFIKINEALTELNRFGIQYILATPEEINILHNLQADGSISISAVTTLPTIYSAAGDTSNYPVPGKIGNIFIDTSAGDVYISIKAIRHDGWKKVN